MDLFEHVTSTPKRSSDLESLSSSNISLTEEQKSYWDLATKFYSLEGIWSSKKEEEKPQKAEYRDHIVEPSQHQQHIFCKGCRM